MPAAKARKYLHSGVITLALCGAAALYLNFEGVRCLQALSGAEESFMSEQELEQAAANCFIITNSYVYSLFGVVAGMILVAVWAFKRNQALTAE